MPKTLFITGASSGIGAATAHAAVASGWNVALMARSEDKLRSLQNELGDAAAIFPGDVTQEADLLRATSGAVDRFGGIEAVFANAGRGLSKPGTEGGDLDDIRGMIDLNITGLVMTARATLPELRKTQGTLVLTGSAAGRRHIAGSIYGATKWFVHGYAGNMAEEMREWGSGCARHGGHAVLRSGCAGQVAARRCRECRHPDHRCTKARGDPRNLPDAAGIERFMLTGTSQPPDADAARDGVPPDRSPAMFPVASVRQRPGSAN